MVAARREDGASCSEDWLARLTGRPQGVTFLSPGWRSLAIDSFTYAVTSSPDAGFGHPDQTRAIAIHERPTRGRPAGSTDAHRLATRMTSLVDLDLQRTAVDAVTTSDFPA